MPLEDRPIFFDIDGTLTDDGHHGGNPLFDRIDQVKSLIASGSQVVIWSGTGTTYARKFAKDHGLEGALAVIGKPETCIDDNDEIRPRKKMRVIDPNEYFLLPPS